MPELCPAMAYQAGVKKWCTNAVTAMAFLIMKKGTPECARKIKHGQEKSPSVTVSSYIIISFSYFINILFFLSLQKNVLLQVPFPMATLPLPRIYTTMVAMFAISAVWATTWWAMPPECVGTKDSGVNQSHDALVPPWGMVSLAEADRNVGCSNKAVIKLELPLFIC